MSHTFDRLTPISLTTYCYDALKKAILNLDLAPGLLLVEQQLAAQLGVSKTPVREALVRLAGEGLVVTEPGRRSFVAGLSPAAIREIFAVRILLEPAAIREITTRLSDQDLADLAQLVNDASSALDDEGFVNFVKANEQFHSFLIEKHENQYLSTIMSDLFERVYRVRAAIRRTELESHLRVHSERGLENHRRILDALVARDAERASEMMTTDIQLFFEMTETLVMQDFMLQLDGRHRADEPGKAGQAMRLKPAEVVVT